VSFERVSVFLTVVRKTFKKKKKKKDEMRLVLLVLLSVSAPILAVHLRRLSLSHENGKTSISLNIGGFNANLAFGKEKNPQNPLSLENKKIDQINELQKAMQPQNHLEM
jgi:hypothetical protein